MTRPQCGVVFICRDSALWTEFIVRSGLYKEAETRSTYPGGSSNNQTLCRKTHVQCSEWEWIWCRLSLPLLLLSQAVETVLCSLPFNLIIFHSLDEKKTFMTHKDKNMEVFHSADGSVCLISVSLCLHLLLSSYFGGVCVYVRGCF